MKVLAVLVSQAPPLNALVAIVTAIAVGTATKYDAVLSSAREVVVPHWWNYLFPWLAEFALASGLIGTVAAVLITVSARRHPVKLLGRRPILEAWLMVLVTVVCFAATALLLAHSVLRSAGV